MAAGTAHSPGAPHASPERFCRLGRGPDPQRPRRPAERGPTAPRRLSAGMLPFCSATSADGRAVSIPESWSGAAVAAERQGSAQRYGRSAEPARRAAAPCVRAAAAPGLGKVFANTSWTLGTVCLTDCKEVCFLWVIFKNYFIFVF